MHLEQGIVHQRHTPQGNFTILPTEIANLSTEIDSGGAELPPNRMLESKIIYSRTRVYQMGSWILTFF